MELFDVGAELFAVVDAGFSVDVDEDEVVLSLAEEFESFGGVEGGIDVKAGEAQDLIAERAEHLAATDVEDSFLILQCRSGHGGFPGAWDET